MLVRYEILQGQFFEILQLLEFQMERASQCAKIFADSTLDGFQSHGINRFPRFVRNIESGYVLPEAQPKKLLHFGAFERWDGQLGPGPLNAKFCMGRAIKLAKEHGMACVALQNTNHWMRGGSYGWQAVAENVIAICFSNTEPNMVPWGASESRTGNNPLVIAVPRTYGPVVLDTSMSQFSYGQLKNYAKRGEKLPFPGGYNAQSELTTDPQAILDSFTASPIGYWKGSGLSILLDLLVTLFSSGRSTAKIGEDAVEYGLSQVFLTFDPTKLNENDKHQTLVNEIIYNIEKATPITAGGKVAYPGSGTLSRRKKHLEEGIPVTEEAWTNLLEIKAKLLKNQ